MAGGGGWGRPILRFLSVVAAGGGWWRVVASGGGWWSHLLGATKIVHFRHFSYQFLSTQNVELTNVMISKHSSLLFSALGSFPKQDF